MKQVQWIGFCLGIGLTAASSLVQAVTTQTVDAPEPIVATEAHRNIYHALLIGVSEYPALEKRFQLNGPKNDVALMREVLLKRGFAPERIMVLADNVEGAAGLPTRQAIFDALGELTEKVEVGDYILLHYSGHGSQQPVTEATAASEPDGLDEIILPRDIGRWNRTMGAVENAIIDDEIEEALTELRERGAFVWAVFDNCHAATVTRWLPPEDWRDRWVEPEALGVGTDETAGTVSRSVDGVNELGAISALAEAQGDYVAFFAAQSNETAPEMRLPRGKPGRQSHGLLTYTLATAMESLPEGVNYRQIGEQVLQSYHAGHFYTPTPLFEGSGLDASIFDQTPGEVVRQWPLERVEDALTVPAGLLHQLDEGALLAVMPTPTAPSEQALGYLTVTHAQVLESRLVPFSPDQEQAIALDAIPEGAYARLLISQPQLALRVAPPLAEEDLPSGETYTEVEREALTLVHAVLTQAGEDEAGLQLMLTDPAGDADVVLRLHQDHLWLTGPGAELREAGPQKTASIHAGAHEALADLVDSHLRPLAKVRNLLQLVRGLNEAQSELDLQTRLLHRTGPDEAFVEIQPGQLPTLAPQSKLRLEFENQGKVSLDVTVLFIDSRYGIDPVYPRGGQLNRLNPGENEVIEGDINATTTGLERMLVIATRPVAGMPPSDFRYLAQASIPDTVRKAFPEDIVRGPWQEVLAFEDQLLKAGFGSQKATRGFTPQQPVTQTATMQLLEWSVAGP